MRKILFIFSCWLVVLSGAARAESFTLADGGAVSGDILKSDDNGIMLRAGDGYTNVAWARFSQDTLKQLAQNPKYKQYVDVFIEPDKSQHPASAEIRLNTVTRLERPAHPSVLGGLFKSPVGLLMLVIIYFANIYAALEVALFRGRPLGQVVALSAVLPLIGPAVFLALPMPKEPEPVETPEEAAAAAAAAAPRKPGAAPTKATTDIEIVEASWKKEDKKPEAQVFARGKFTFNKRFIETKFAGYIGEPKGDAKKFSMEAKTGAGQFMVEYIAQIGLNEMILETPNGQVTVPFGDILEIKLVPKPA